MATQLPNGRWRGRATNAEGKRVAPHTIIGGPRTYSTEPKAITAETKAKELVASRAETGVTVGEWGERWLENNLSERSWSPSTLITYTMETKEFRETYSDLPIRSFNIPKMLEYLGQHSVPVGKRKLLNQMFEQARKLSIIDRNPFSTLTIPSHSGNKFRTPPTEVQWWTTYEVCKAVTTPWFAAWFLTGGLQGMRTGELDYLLKSKVDFEAGYIYVDWQWENKSQTKQRPKGGKTRKIPLHPIVREALLALPETDSPFFFINLAGNHFRRSARKRYWNKVRAQCPFLRGDEENDIAPTTLYLATRHYCGWYQYNIRRFDVRMIADNFGHEDTDLVKKLYGHPDAEITLKQLHTIYAETSAKPPVKIALPESFMRTNGHNSGHKMAQSTA